MRNKTYKNSHHDIILAVTGGNNLAGRIPSEFQNMINIQDFNVGEKVNDNQ